MKIYRHICKNDKVYKDEAQDYAMDQLGITIKPVEKDGTYSQEQIDFMGEFTDWYFSGDWVLEEETQEIETPSYNCSGYLWEVR